MLFLLLKNAKDSSLAESSCLMQTLATHTKKIKSFDGKRGGSHKMLLFSKLLAISPMSKIYFNDICMLHIYKLGFFD